MSEASRTETTPPGGRLSRSRLVVFGLVTALVVALGTAVALEVGARLWLGDAFTPGLPMGRPVEATAVWEADRGWANRAGVHTRVVAPKFSYRVTINSKGLRDAEHAYEPAPGTVRIALLGDSMAWGWGVDDGLDFADLVEEALGPDVEVINLACPGYGNDQELLTLQSEGARYRPDLVLVCVVLNDVLGNASIHGQGMPYEKPRFERDADGAWVLANHPVPPPRESAEAREIGVPEWLYSNSAFFKLIFPEDPEEQLAQARREQEGGQGKRERPASTHASIEDMCADLVDPDSVTHMLLGRLRATAADLGAPMVAFSVAHHHDQFLYAANVPPPAGVVGADPPFETCLSTRLREAGEELGFRTFSVDQAMLAAVLAEGDLHCGDGHLNELGNRVVAERIVEELRPIVAELRAAR